MVRNQLCGQITSVCLRFHFLKLLRVDILKKIEHLNSQGDVGTNVGRFEIIRPKVILHDD